MRNQEFKLYQKTSLILIIILLSYLAGQIINAIIMSSFAPDISEKIIYLTKSHVNEIWVLRLLQFISASFSFLIPALIINRLFSQNNRSYISSDHSPALWYYLLIPVLVFSVMPLMNIIIEWNESIVLPDILADVEAKMKEMEDSSQQMINLMLSGTSSFIISVNIILVAVLPALGEEFLFRGVIQKHLKELLRNYHIAIFISAFLFSAVHFQFYGFIPRLLLGMVFGYLAYFSGSVWPAVFAHFFNNLMAILVTYLSDTNEIIAETDSFGTKSSDIYFIIMGVILTGLIFWIMVKYKRREEGL